MMSAPPLDASPRLILRKQTAADLMTPNPVSIRREATIPEAVELLTRRGISAVPVIDEAGQPVGVLSRTDIVVHDREAMESLAPGEYRGDTTASTTSPTRVADIMTPAVFCVSPQVGANRVVHEMVTLKIHRLFVVDSNKTLVGVISVLDVLRRLQG
jgi:CBS-domain-containing membrane protein